MNSLAYSKNGSFYLAMQVITYLLSGALIVFLPACDTSSPAKPPSHPLAVRTAEVRTGLIKETLRYVGTVHSRNEIKVLARVSGKVAGLPIAEGERAIRGKTLARIAAPEMDAKVSRMQADVARIKEESRFLCQQADIDRDLLASAAISKVKADASRQKCDSSQAALRAAEAGLRELDVMAGNSVERAPFDGVVLKWLAERGENVMPGRPILIYGDTPLEVRVMVHEKDVAAGIRKGMPVILLPDHPQSIRTEVAFVSPLASGPGRMMEARIPLTQEDADRFRHGMSLDIAFVLREKSDAVIVPELAIHSKGVETGLYRIKNDKAHWEKTTVSLREGPRVAIDTNLKPGDRVAVGNLDVLKDGMTVYPVGIEGGMP